MQKYMHQPPYGIFMGWVQSCLRHFVNIKQSLLRHWLDLPHRSGQTVVDLWRGKHCKQNVRGKYTHGYACNAFVPLHKAAHYGVADPTNASVMLTHFLIVDSSDEFVESVYIWIDSLFSKISNQSERNWLSFKFIECILNTPAYIRHTETQGRNLLSSYSYSTH